MHAPQLAAPTRASGRLLIAIAVVGALAAAVIAAAPAQAAVDDKYKYYDSYSAGTGIRFEGSAASVQTRLYNLQGQSGAASTSSYSVDFSGTPPTNNNNYTQKAWTELGQGGTPESRGAVEWILKNSYPRVTTTTLRDTLRATQQFSAFPTGYFNESEAIAATQAAIWHFTDGANLDLVNTSPNTARIKLLYQYLVQEASGKPASSSEAPALELQSETDRTSFAVEPGAAFGPFAIDASTTATITVAGPARIVGESGQALTGAQQPGTRFWVQPTADPAADGSAVLRAQTASVTTTFVNIALGAQHVSPYAARETLAVLATSTQAANAELAVAWEIDRNAPDQFDTEGGATIRDYIYYPRAELSPTLERISFTDGTSTETDLVGITGRGSARSADVYSADFASTAVSSVRGPSIPSGTVFHEGDWQASAKLAGNAGQGQVARILQQSYPERSVAQLTEALKGAGLLVPSSGNIKNWEAIAAAQAAIWHFTDGKDLDVTRYADPVAVTASSTDPVTSPENVLGGDAASGWRAGAPGEAYLDFTFPADFEPRSYAVTSLDGGAAANAPTAWRLQRSSDGATYSDVSTGSVSHSFAGGAAETRASGSIPPGASYGAYTTRYRIVFSGAADPAQPVEIGAVSFEGFGVFGTQPNYVYKQYANSTNVVLAYRYLVDDAEANPVGAPTAELELHSDSSSFERGSTTELIGPFTVRGSLTAEVALAEQAGARTLSAQTSARLLTDPTGERSESLVLAAGSEFWIDPGEAESGSLSIVARSTAIDWVTSRALTAASGQPTLTQLGVESKRVEATLSVAFSLAAETSGGGVDEGSGGTGEGTDPEVVDVIGGGDGAKKASGSQAPIGSTQQLARAGFDATGLAWTAIALLTVAAAALLVARRWEPRPIPTGSGRK